MKRHKNADHDMQSVMSGFAQPGNNHSGELPEGTPSDLTSASHEYAAPSDGNSHTDSIPYSDLFEHAPVPAALISETLSIYRVNRALRSLTGVTEDPFYSGSEITQIFQPASAERFRACIRDCIQNKKDSSCKCTLVNNLVVNINVAASNYDQKLIIQCIFLDITEQGALEQKLKQSEIRFSSLVEYAPISIVVVLDGIIKYTNPFAAKLLGFENPDASKETSLFALMSDLDRLKVIARYSRVLQGDTNNSMEIKIKTVDGRSIITESVFLPIESEHGNPALVIGIDITERKKALLDLETSENLLRNGFNALADAVSIIDKNFHLVWYNNSLKVMAEVNGVHLDGATGKSIFTLFPFLPHKIQEEYEEAVRTRKPVYSEECIKVNGKIWYTETVKCPIVEQGEVRLVITVIRDITAKKFSELALQESEDKFRALIEATPDLICYKDEQGRWMQANQSLLRLLSLETISFYKKTDDEIAQMADADFDSFFRRALITDSQAWDSGQMMQYQEEVSDITGTKHFFDVIKIPLYNSDTSRKGLVVFSRDITRYKQIEVSLREAVNKAEEMNRVKSIFFSNMSHELRIPLIGILGYSELLSQNLKGHKSFSDMATKIHNSGKRLLDTLNQLLEFSRIESSGIEPDYTEFPLSPLLEEISDMYQPVAKSKGLSFVMHKVSELTLVRSDVSLLRSVISNLVSNAVKYTETGIVTIETRELQQDIEFIITDSGPGISPEVQEQIWQPFRQGSEGLGRNYEGTGLGLTIVKKYCELIGAVVTLNSERGKGSQFKVMLRHGLVYPIKKHPGGLTMNEALRYLQKNAESDKKQIPSVLLLEDDAITRDFIKEVIGKDVSLDTACNVQEALEKSEVASYQLFLIDINLGEGLSGIDFLNTLRKTEQYKSTPCVAVTAYASDDDRKRFLSDGFNYFLPKPFPIAEIERCLKTLLPEYEIRVSSAP